MNKNLKLLIAIIGFAAFLALVWMIYKDLSRKYSAEKPLDDFRAIESVKPDPSGKDGTASPNSGDPSRESTTGKPSDESQATGSAEPDKNDDDRIAAPDFTVFTADGDEVRLSDFRGTPVVLNFWASWCGPCRSEMPEFNKVSQEYSEDQLMFLMVDLVDGDWETVESGKSFIEENNYTFRVVYDTRQDAADKYGIRSIPTTYFIDAEGNVVTGAVGAIDEKTLRRGIEMIYPGK
jgi:thiol-disulfide isomerase/thioredoxin